MVAGLDNILNVVMFTVQVRKFFRNYLLLSIATDDMSKEEQSRELIGLGLRLQWFKKRA